MAKLCKEAERDFVGSSDGSFQLGDLLCSWAQWKEESAEPDAIPVAGFCLQ